MQFSKDTLLYFVNRILNPTILRVILVLVSCVLILVSSVYLSLIKVPVWQEKSLMRYGRTYFDDTVSIKASLIKKEKVALERKIKKLDVKIDNFIPRSNYILINTTSNNFYLYKYKELIRKGRCSTGSYTLLVSEKKKKQWIFKTPKGKFYIHGKTTDPIWIKPDWAFVEEGLPVPSAFHPSRYETGVLGDYALSLGQGYMIHGTLYKRFLGMPVTHGCIRLNDEDLDVVYHSLEVGSRVYIY
jgi:L,D-transpeptidase ErfK/SrfK